MLDIERWVKWAQDKGFELCPNTSGRCDICNKEARGNKWMCNDFWEHGLAPVVCKSHAQEHGLLW